MAVRWNMEGLDKVEWDIRRVKTGATKTGKPRYTVEVENIITVDTETSTGYFDALGRCYPYNHSRAAEGFYDDKNPSSLLYLWQSAVEDKDIKVYMGREYGSLAEYLNKIAVSVFRQAKNLHPQTPDDRVKELMAVERERSVATVHVWIHNLGYEFQFFRNFLEPLWVLESNSRKRRNRAVFARTARKPMRVTFTFSRIRWVLHDTLVLVQKKLKDWGKDEKLPVQKLDEPADFYLPIRTPLTPLTEEEIKYGENDVVTMVYGLRKARDKWENLGNIPMTQTGAIRRACNGAAKSDREWINKTHNAVMAYDYETYKDLCDAYLGGYVHTNYRYTGTYFRYDEETKTGTMVRCFDFRSSYPAWMVLKKFPVGPLLPVSKDEWDKECAKPANDRSKQGVARLTLVNVKAKTQNTFWSLSKCHDFRRVVLDNGKIYKADMIEITISDLDWDIFRAAYDFEIEAFHRARLAIAERLPKCLILLILKYYKYKTSLKGKEELASLYAESKQFINSIYGCAVTRIISDIIEFVGGEDPWNRKYLDEDQYYEDIQEVQKKEQFLSYQIGVWVAAWARWNLWQAILRLDPKVIYCDTDSIKGLFGHAELDIITELNAGVQAETEKAAEELGIDIAKFAPKTQKDKVKEIGYFDREPDCVEFVAWGAKRYCYRVAKADRDPDPKKHDTGLHLTVAGLPKQGIRLLRDDVRNFQPGLKWSGSQSGKTTALYLDNQSPRRWRDRDGRYYETTDRYGIAMTPATFEFDLAEEYKDFLDFALSGIWEDDENCAKILRT